MSRPHVGIIGGGVLGTVLTYRLASRGVRVTLLERSNSLGGLAASMDFDGHTVDRFYHVIVPSDGTMLGLVDELGLGEHLRFSETGVGFYIDGELVPLNGLGDFLRFRPLTVSQRVRLGWFVAQCQLRRSYSKLDEVPLQPWLRRHCGKGVVERIWKPLLESRFDGSYDELPATYMWARTRRMRSARTGKGAAETMGCLDGGHQRLIDALADASRSLGAEINCGVGVEGLVTNEAGAVTGARVEGETRDFDLTVATLQPQHLGGLLPETLQPLLDAYPQRWLGVVCVVLKTRRSVLPFYSVNICEPTPVTTIVETSHVVGTDHTDGLRLVYIPKYCEATAAEFTESEDSLRDRFVGYLGQLAPGFTKDDVVASTVQRAPIVEPVHGLGAARQLPPVWPGVDGLALASNAQIYPSLLSGESVSAFATDVADQVLAKLGK